MEGQFQLVGNDRAILDQEIDRSAQIVCVAGTICKATEERKGTGAVAV